MKGADKMAVPTEPPNLLSMSLHDAISPHKVSLVDVVFEYCLARSTTTYVVLQPGEPREAPPLECTESEDREFMFLLLQLLQSADLPLVELMTQIRNVANEELVNRLSAKLTELNTQGLRGLMNLFQDLPNVLFREPAPLLHKTSVLGLFVRRMWLAFERLSFSEVAALQKRYAAYHGAWQAAGSADPAWRQAEHTGLDPLDESGGGAQCAYGRYSLRQAEYAIATQAWLLGHSPRQALTPARLQQQVRSLLTSNPSLAEAHYLSYLNCLRVKEYCGAIDSLTHYFDRRTPAVEAGGVGRGRSEDETASRGFRYAALNMATLHYRFGHREEARAAVQEAIRIAQENNDHVCLQHALAWLHRLHPHQPQDSGGGGALLERFVSKSGELNLPYLVSLGVQARTQLNARTKVLPASIFEYLLKSDIINCQSSFSDLLATSYAQKAALWWLFGKQEMCSLNAQLLLHLNTQHQGVYQSGEAECLALCQLARLYADGGHETVAHSLLDQARARFPPGAEHSHIWRQERQRLQLEQATQAGRWEAADSLVASLVTLDKEEGRLAHAQMCVERGECDTGLALCDALLPAHHAPHLMCRALLLRGRLLVRRGVAWQASQPLLAALDLARQHHLTRCAAAARLHLAHMQLVCGAAHGALRLMEAALLPTLTAASLHGKATAHYLWITCQLRAHATPGKERERVLRQSVCVLSDVIAAFRRTESRARLKQALYVQARVYTELGEVGQRNQCARMFRELEEEYPAHTALSPLAVL